MRDSPGRLLRGHERQLPDIQGSVKARFGILAVLLLGACGSNEQKILPGPSTGGSAATSGGSAATSGGSAAMSSGGGSNAGCAVTDNDPASCGDRLTTATACGDVRLARLGDQLFWTERQSGRVRAMSTTGGAVTDIAVGEVAPNRLAVDESGVYWIDAGDGSSGGSKLMKAALPFGEAPVALRTAPPSDPAVAIDAKVAFVGVAVASGKVYYGLGYNVHAISTDPADTSDEIVGVAFARNDTRMPDGVPDGLTLHNGRVYWVIADVGSVESDDLLPGTDGLPRVAHSGGMWPNDLGFAGDFVYFAAFASLYAAQPNVPAVAVASSADDADLAAFAVTATDGYFADQAGGLSRHALALPAAPDFQPTAAVPLTHGQGKITSVVLDDTHVYWASVDEATGNCAIRALGL
jgi:hypothetical protein